MAVACRGASPRAGVGMCEHIGMSVVIRRFEQQDCKSVSDLIRRTMGESNSDEYPPEVLVPLIEYFTPEKVAALAAERYCVVAETDSGHIVGTAALEGNELVTFFVSPDQQSAGIGTALLEALERDARRLHLAHLHVKSSLTGAAFYERRGFVRTGRVVSGTAGEQIEMEKPLGQDPAASDVPFA